MPLQGCLPSPISAVLHVMPARATQVRSSELTELCTRLLASDLARGPASGGKNAACDGDLCSVETQTGPWKMVRLERLRYTLMVSLK